MLTSPSAGQVLAKGMLHGGWGPGRGRGGAGRAPAPPPPPCVLPASPGVPRSTTSAAVLPPTSGPGGESTPMAMMASTPLTERETVM